MCHQMYHINIMLTEKFTCVLDEIRYSKKKKQTKKNVK